MWEEHVCPSCLPRWLPRLSCKLLCLLHAEAEAGGRGLGWMCEDWRRVFIWYLTARRWFGFLKKALRTFWFWQPLAVTWGSPCPAGLLGTISPYTSAVAKKTSPLASGTGPSVFQWSHKHLSPYVMLYEGRWQQHRQLPILHSLQLHCSALGQSQRRDKRQGFLLGTFRKRSFNRK